MRPGVGWVTGVGVAATDSLQAQPVGSAEPPGMERRVTASASVRPGEGWVAGLARPASQSTGRLDEEVRAKGAQSNRMFSHAHHTFRPRPCHPGSHPCRACPTPPARAPPLVQPRPPQAPPPARAGRRRCGPAGSGLGYRHRVRARGLSVRERVRPAPRGRGWPG